MGAAAVDPTGPRGRRRHEGGSPMSRYALELALYDLSVRRDVRGAYAKDPD